MSEIPVLRSKKLPIGQSPARGAERQAQETVIQHKYAAKNVDTKNQGIQVDFSKERGNIYKVKCDQHPSSQVKKSNVQSLRVNK